MTNIVRGVQFAPLFLSLTLIGIIWKTKLRHGAEKTVIVVYQDDYRNLGSNPNHLRVVFFRPHFALALTMLGLFCFHHFPKMIVLRRVVAQTRFFPSIISLGMIVLRRVVAHRAVLTMLGCLQNFSYNRSLWNQGLTCIIRKWKTKSYNTKAFRIKDLQAFLGVL